MPLNPIGRDFVIGDVHGAFDEVWEAMKAVGFDRSRDRLFSVGDLVDRGEGSHRASRFLDQPYVHAEAGNHEVALLELYRDQDDPDVGIEMLARMNWNGMGWLAKVSAEDRAAMLEQMAQLPIVIEVETARGLVGLVHGEVPLGMNWSTFMARIEAGHEATITSCLEGRTRVERHDTSGVPGIGRIYSGHTIRWEGAERLGNVWAIDTGAVMATHPRNPRGRMTIADMVSKTGGIVDPRVVGNVHVHDQAAEHAVDSNQPIPFGRYAEPSAADDAPQGHAPGAG